MRIMFNLMIENYEYSDNNYVLDLLQRRTKINSTLTNLMYYKSLIECGVLHNNFSKYSFETIILPFQLELCLSAPISVLNPRGICFNHDYQEINIVNIFPYNGKTIIIFGFSNEFENIWQKTMCAKLKSNDAREISLSIQNIVYRAEFHCISKTLHDSISDDIPNFIAEWYDNIDNFDLNLNVRTNIFHQPISELKK